MEPAQSTPDPISETHDHLKLLGIFYYLIALMAVPALILLFSQGWVFDWMMKEAQAQGAEDSIEPLFRAAQVSLILLAIVHLIAWIYVGNCFRKHKHHTLCIVAAAFSCLSFPLGTVLGVFSLIVLTKPAAKTLFGVQTAP